MIAWLLTPNGEHGLGRAFVEHMGDLLAEKGVPLLKNALRAGDPITVATEWPEQGCRYDIRLKVGTHHFILENKTKSIGGKTQRDAYEQRGYIVILLGLTPFSFEPKLRKDCHLVTYRHVESFLKSLLPFSDNDFGVLLRHYHQFLTRELHLLQDLIEIAFEHEDKDARKEISTLFDETEYRSNDRRFINIHYLEKFTQYLNDRNMPAQGNWESFKNQSSSAYMSMYGDGLPQGYRFNNVLQSFCGTLFFHLELHDNALCQATDNVGGILLRYQRMKDAAGSNESVVCHFREKHPELKDILTSRPSAKDETFSLVRQPLHQEQLSFHRLADELERFMRMLGSWAPTDPTKTSD